MKELTAEIAGSLIYDLSLQIAANEAILDKMLAMFAEASPEGAFALADEMTRMADGLETGDLAQRASVVLGTTEAQMVRAIEISVKRWRQFAAAAGGDAPPECGGLRVITGGKLEE